MISLKGQFLVAMPEMGDERFRDSVIYMVGHGDDGAIGLMVNQSLDDMRFVEVLEELELGDSAEPRLRAPLQRLCPRWQLVCGR